ncbi:MAG: hypothetical protein JW864_12740 [Spirochaetes bacterium]|nr:hypothetical protein [Spirochaetota bacterium]
MKRQELNPKDIKIELNVRAISHILKTFEADYGKDELAKFMERTGLPVKYFDNEYNWVSYDYYFNLLEQLVKYTGDKETPYKYGLNTPKYINSWGIWKAVLTLIMSPAYIYKTIVFISPRFCKFCKYKIIEKSKNKIILKLKYENNVRQNKLNCENMRGQFASIPTLCDLPYAEVKELQCTAEGADSCVFEIIWKKNRDRKNKIFSLLITIFIISILYFLINYKIINSSILVYFTIILIPIAFFLGGHVLDYKRTIKDNSDILDEQNHAIISSLQNTQQINEELQIKIDQRTEEIKETNKKLEATYEQIRNTERKLLIAERMRGVARLAAGVAHEINNPMGAVRNYIQEMLEDIPHGDKRNDILEKAEKATQISKTLINDLLSFSRMDDDLQIIEMDINEVIDKITSNIQQTFSNFNIKINNFFDPDLPTIHSDPLQINQIFTNLIINSYNAIKEEGEIEIKTFFNKNEIRVDIRDNGDIIPAYIIDQIFDPNQKDKDRTGRNELGLVISYNIVKRFNGDIKIKSLTGEGTTFAVSLPYN